MILSEYLQFLNEQRLGNQPPNPVKKPQPAKGPNQIKSKVPKQPTKPINPQEQSKAKSYFNYMVWSTKIIKQGEIFRKSCYGNNCQQFALGSGDRRVCKDRCDIETCKKIIAMLKASINSCDKSQNPEQCKRRFTELIPLYQKKLNMISSKFISSNKKETKKPNVG
jgi:hypothetical protein